MKCWLRKFANVTGLLSWFFGWGLGTRIFPLHFYFSSGWWESLGIFTLFTSLPYAKMWSTTLPQTSFRSWDFVKHVLIFRNKMDRRVQCHRPFYWVCSHLWSLARWLNVRDLITKQNWWKLTEGGCRMPFHQGSTHRINCQTSRSPSPNVTWAVFLSPSPRNKELLFSFTPS